jgi:hypothetical protein
MYQCSVYICGVARLLALSFLYVAHAINYNYYFRAIGKLYISHMWPVGCTVRITAL